ncbi:MAG: 3-isopropylmalate dehydratase small subunit [gamma proteobacterium symbiont of Taylorina sp.]|nr:3-isopropylmalate dehydratase small subunit [gamma proteobacterium symbiont of Taylorina sp.]
MEKLTKITAISLPLDRANVDTDAIIPKQFLKSIKRSGFGPNLFDEWRYLDQGEPGMDNTKRPLNYDFVLNQPRYQGAEILLARDNFGCGSSREHAPWALEDFGIRVIIAPGFADIFYNNCFKNGLLPIVLEEKIVDHLFDLTQSNEGFQLIIDLEKQKIQSGIGFPAVDIDFELDEFRRHCLLEGLDEIGLTMAHANDIRAYEKSKKEVTPWLY